MHANDPYNQLSYAVRNIWAKFQPWYKAHQALTQKRMEEAMRTSGIHPSRIKEVEKLLHEKFIAEARREFITRIQRQNVFADDWVMTKEDKKALKATLGWTREEMVKADKYPVADGEEEDEGDEDEEETGEDQEFEGPWEEPEWPEMRRRRGEEITHGDMVRNRADTNQAALTMAP